MTGNFRGVCPIFNRAKQVVLRKQMPCQWSVLAVTADDNQN